MWAVSRRRCGGSPGADKGRIPAQMWAASRRRCGRHPAADVAGHAFQELRNLRPRRRRRHHRKVVRHHALHPRLAPPAKAPRGRRLGRPQSRGGAADPLPDGRHGNAGAAADPLGDGRHGLHEEGSKGGGGSLFVAAVCDARGGGSGCCRELTSQSSVRRSDGGSVCGADGSTSGSASQPVWLCRTRPRPLRPDAV